MSIYSTPDWDRPRRRRLPSRRTTGWGGIALLAATMVASMLCLSSCLAQEKQAFTEKCLAAHPDAHVSQTDHYGYKSYTRDLYCLGPDGQLWDVQ